MEKHILPYISGSNYLLKMSHYKKGEWCDALDGLYWQFIARKSDFLMHNHRMAMMVNLLEKMDDEKKERIFNQGKHFTTILCSSEAANDNASSSFSSLRHFPDEPVMIWT